MAHDAVPTWSGYNYQGKVAIYCALKKINDLNGSGHDIEKVKDYKLEIEYLEDFAIIDNSNTYLSVHQVKAGDSFDSYNEIEAWFDKNIDGVHMMDYCNVNNDTKAFIIAQDEKMVYRTKKAEKLTYADTIVICNKSDIEQIKPFIHASTSSGQNANNCIEYKILTSLLPTQLPYDLQNIKDCFKDYLPYDSSVKRFLHVSKTHQWTNHIYSYQFELKDSSRVFSMYSQNNCSVEEVDNFIDNQIMIYKSRTASQIKSIRLKLHDLLAQHIANRHKNHGNNPGKCINFSEILSLLDSNSINIDIEDDAYLELQNRFAKYLDEYKIKLVSQGKLINQNLHYLSAFVSNMDRNCLKIFVRLISPNKEVNKENISDLFTRLIQEEIIKTPYLNIINELQNNQLIFNDSKIFSYKINAKNYLPSTINDGADDATSVASCIMKNYQNDPEVYSLLMNITEIITREINLDNINNESPHIHQYDNDAREQFMKISKIRLIDKNTAKAEINE